MNKHCCYCLKRLPFIFIQCTQCQEVLLCPNCFRLGAESSKHKRCHKYALGKSASRWVEFVWTVEKELAFLEYVESCGLGNWLDISAKLGNLSPLECRRHYESIYISGIMSSIHKPPRHIMELGTKDQLDDERVAIYKALLRVPLSFCKKLGLMPKRGDYECDYDNNAEASIARIRSDFLEDELYRDLTLARIDMFVEILRRRRMRHLVAAKLNLLTHVLPKLLPSKATSSSYGDSHVRAMSGQSQLSSGSSRPSRRCLISQRRFGQRMLQATRFGHIGERSGKLGDLSTEETVKQPPPSIESLQDSGVAFSESSIHSLPSLDTPGTASVSSPTEDAATCEDNSRDASSPTTLTRIWSCSLPSVGYNPLEVISSVYPSGMYPSPSTPCWTMTKNSGTRNRSIIKAKLPNQSDWDLCLAEPPKNCCIPPHFAEPLKPLLRFLSTSEANILLRQLHREHVLRQEIEQLQQLKKSQGIFLNGTHLAGEILSTTGNDSDGSSPEDTTQSLASRTGAVGMLSRRRRSIFFGVSRRSRRRVDRLSTPVGVEPERGVRRGGATAFPTGNGVAPRRRGRPSLHNQGNRQQSQRHQLIHM